MRQLLALQLPSLTISACASSTTADTADLYEVIIERHSRASTIIMNDSSVEKWIPLFADPILAQSTIDRFAHNTIMSSSKARPTDRVRTLKSESQNHNH